MWHWKGTLFNPFPPRNQHPLATFRTLCKPNCSFPRSQGLNRDICKNKMRKSCYHLFMFLAKKRITPKTVRIMWKTNKRRRPPRCWRRGPSWWDDSCGRLLANSPLTSQHFTPRAAHPSCPTGSSSIFYWQRQRQRQRLSQRQRQRQWQKQIYRQQKKISTLNTVSQISMAKLLLKYCQLCYE